MKIKTIITALLLVFVMSSLAYLFVGEYRKINKGHDAEQHTSDQSAVNKSSNGIAQEAPPSKNHRVVIAYYFHGKARCPSCLKIEAYTKEAIFQNFENELKDGHLNWQAVNVEETENRHFIKDYQLYTKSVVIVDTIEGKQTRWKNLKQVWELLHDKGTFLHYINDEINAYLGGG